MLPRRSRSRHGPLPHLLHPSARSRRGFRTPSTVPPRLHVLPVLEAASAEVAVLVPAPRPHLVPHTTVCRGDPAEQEDMLAPGGQPAHLARGARRRRRQLDRLRRDHELVLVDTPPVIDSDARRAIRAADLVIVPVQPSAPDLWAAEGTLKIAQDEKRPVCVVLNRVPSTGRQRAAMEAALQAAGTAAIAAHDSAAADKAVGRSDAAHDVLAAVQSRGVDACLVEADLAGQGAGRCVVAAATAGLGGMDIRWPAAPR